MPFSFRIYESSSPPTTDGTNLARAPNDLEQMAHQLAAQEAELKRLRQAVLRDPVTDGANLRSLELAFDGLDVADPCSLLMVDIGALAQVNDTLGRTAGDAVIQAVARTMERCVRWDDVVAREGGNRFIILLPLAIDQDAHAVAERIRASVAKMCFKTDHGRFRVTVAIGCATRDQDEPLAPAVARADRACRDGKEQGGDIVFFG
jgi:diguanylate cyclase (GGDEF)-like protein